MSSKTASLDKVPDIAKRELARAQCELAEIKTRLQLHKNISSGLISETAVDTLIENTVREIHRVFPYLRINYSSVTPQFTIKVENSTAPVHMSGLKGMKFQLEPKSRLLLQMKKMSPIVVEDVVHAPVLDPLRSQIKATGARAVIIVPLPHPQLELGLVCCEAVSPRRWSEHEIATMVDMAEYLALAIRQAHSQQEREAIERQLRDSQKMEAVGRLVGGIAHDFNNLLTAMMIYCGLLSTSLGKSHRLCGHVDQIRQAGERGANLVSQLLALTRQQVLEPRIVTIGALVEEMRDMLQRMIGEDVVLLTKCAQDLSSARVDEAQLQQVILNMAINARDAMPSGGQLALECSNQTLTEKTAKQHHLPPGEYVSMRISDNGHGMDAKTKAQIFDPFFTTKGQGKGTGLGLSTAYGIVKQHGGNITVKSEVGEGTEFTILLPSIAGIHVSHSVDQEVMERSPQRETVLLVEDEEMVRRSLVEILRLGGYNVLEAEGGEQALSVSQGHAGNISLMITDLVMPGMNGRQVADAMALRRPEMPVLFISGYSDDPRTRAMLGEGADFFRKPFTMEGLGKKVRQTLDRHSAPRSKKGSMPAHPAQGTAFGPTQHGDISGRGHS